MLPFTTAKKPTADEGAAASCPFLPWSILCHVQLAAGEVILLSPSYQALAHDLWSTAFLVAIPAAKQRWQSNNLHLPPPL